MYRWVPDEFQSLTAPAKLYS